MAQFHVGQRVRLIAYMTGDLRDIPIGAEGACIGPYCAGYVVVRFDCDPQCRACATSQITPLTDPKAEAFLESIRQLKPLPVQEIA